MLTTMSNMSFMLEHKLEALKVSFKFDAFFASDFHVFILGVDLFNDDKPYKQTNLQSLDTLTRDSTITAMSWSDENANEVLIGRADSLIRTYDCEKDKFYETDLTIGEGAVTGLAWSNE